MAGCVVSPNSIASGGLRRRGFNRQERSINPPAPKRTNRVLDSRFARSTTRKKHPTTFAASPLGLLIFLLFSLSLGPSASSGMTASGRYRFPLDSRFYFPQLLPMQLFSKLYDVLVECKCARAHACLSRVNTKNADRALLIFNSRVKIGRYRRVHYALSSTLFVQLPPARGANNITRVAL